MVDGIAHVPEDAIDEYRNGAASRPPFDLTSRCTGGGDA
jgi:hypothetical protein